MADAITRNGRAIRLMAGEAKLEGQAIADNIDKVNETLKKIASIKRYLGILDALLGFVAAVLTGSGSRHRRAGIRLADDLSAPEKA